MGSWSMTRPGIVRRPGWIRATDGEHGATRTTAHLIVPYARQSITRNMGIRRNTAALSTNDAAQAMSVRAANLNRGAPTIG